MQQLDQETGAQVSALTAAEDTARRAQETAKQQEQVVTGLVSDMQAKTKAIQTKMNTLDSAAFTQAMSVFSKTGSFPLTRDPRRQHPRRGSPAGRAVQARRPVQRVGSGWPSAFDCSGLVLWAYAQEGIHLEHFTGDQWNEGVPGLQTLQPGDLVFFFPTISHVGMYIGDGLMVSADFGQDVMVQPVMWILKAIASAEQAPCFRAFLLPLGAPPAAPCIRQTLNPHGWRAAL